MRNRKSRVPRGASVGLLLWAILVASSTDAGTVAYWRCEEGQSGQRPQDTGGDPASGPYSILDSSGNGYHLATWNADTAPLYVSTVAVPVVPSTGAENTLAFDFTPNEDIFTPGYADFEAMTFNAWTLEASFNVDNVTRFHGLVGKDGKPVEASTLAPLQLKVRDNNDLLQIEILDAAGTERQVSSTLPITPGQWYHAAAVNDGSTLELFLDRLDGNGYVSQGSVEVTGGALFDSVGAWTVGRGFWNNGITDWTDGRIDEIRISDLALAPSEFLFSVAPTLAWDGLGDGVWQSDHWTGGQPGSVPGAANPAVVRNNTVTVAADAAAYELTVESGGVTVAGGRTLTVAATVGFAVGTTLALQPGASLVVGGGGRLAEVSAVIGDTTIHTADDLDVTYFLGNVLPSTNGTFTKRGPGTLTLNNRSGTHVVAAGTSFKVEEGTLRSSGSDPLGGARKVELAGGRLSVFGPAAQGEAVAYWRFEEGPLDTQTTLYQGDWFLDSSGNGNHMWTWADFTAPTYRSDVPFDSIPQTGVENNFSLEFNPNQDLYTINKSINGFSFDALTVEVSVKLDSVTGWQAIVGKDGMPTEAPNPPFVLKFNDAEKDFEAVLIDGSGTVRPLLADVDPVLGQWYHLAVTNDGSMMRLFVKGPGDFDYIEQGSGIEVAGGALIDSNESWTVGRGAHNGGITDWIDATIDEVRISSTALDPSEFLASAADDGQTLDMSGTQMLVTADSSLHAVSESGAPFGPLTMEAGTLATSGVGGISFAGTTIAAGATTVGFDLNTDTDLGTIAADGVTPVTIAKAGPVDLVLDNTNTGLQNATFDVRKGRLIGVGGSDVFGGAGLRLGGGDLVLAADAAGNDVHYDNAVMVMSDGTLTAGTGGIAAAGAGPLTLTLGSAANGLALGGGTLKVRATDQYRLTVAGSLSGSGSLSVEQGRVTLAAADNAAGNVKVAAGSVVDTGGRDVTLSEGLRLDQTTFRIDPGNTFKANGSDLLAGVDLTLTGGTLSVLGPDARTETVAYWRFEEGVDGQSPQDTAEDPPSGPYPILDSSGNDYHLATWNADTAPLYVSTVAVPVVPLTGAENTLAFDFTPNEDIFTPGYADFEAMTFDAWTIEASFNVDDVTRYHGLVGKDGKPVEASTLAPLQLKVRDNNDLLQIEILDASGTERQVSSTLPITPGQWYHAAAVNDGSTLELFLDSLDGSGYVSQGSVEVTGGALIDSVGAWTVGRGFWNNGITDWTDGRIDEVRISDRALDVSEFLGSEAPPAEPLDLPTSNFTVASDSTLKLVTYEDATLGNLTLQGGTTLTITGAAAGFADVDAGDGSSIDGSLLVSGTLSPDSGPGRLTIDGTLEMGGEAKYLCELAEAAGDLVEVTDDAYLDGALELRAVGGLGTVGDASRTILQVTDEEGSVLGTFATEPAAGDHLGHGVFHQAVDYDGASVTVDVFQAAPGDTDGNRQIDNVDLQLILGANSFNQGAGFDWLQGDFDGDTDVDNGDLQLILGTGWFGTGPYAAMALPLVAQSGLRAVPEPSALLLLAGGAIALLVSLRHRRSRRV